jgi:hypothetical protein
LWGFLILVLGSTIFSFFLLAFAEFLQLLLKIEINTRKTEILLEAKKTIATVKKAVAKKTVTKKPTKKVVKAQK